MEPTREFKEWAIGFSGCDGGNLDGPIWFCGIEWGIGNTEEDLKFDDVSTPKFWTDKDRENCFKGKYPYDRGVVKLYAAILRSNETDYAKIAKSRVVFGEQSELFKLNLYPIAFSRDQDELWQKWLYVRTGLATKSMYRAWCQDYRFPEMQRWVRKHAPRLIVCTSRTYLQEFIMAFDGIDKIFDSDSIHEWQTVPPQPPRKLSWVAINEGRTILVVTPFLGRTNGLNSDSLLTEFGHKIAEICESHFGRIDWMQK